MQNKPRLLSVIQSVVIHITTDFFIYILTKTYVTIMHLKNILLLLAVCGLCNMAAATQAKLVINNPAPRVGDEINITIVFTNNPTEKTNDFYGAQDYLVKSELKINQAVTKAGSIWVGPFTFKIGGEELTTDSVLLQVAAALPTDKNSLIIRQLTFDNEEYLVVEQIIPQKANYAALKKTAGGKGITLNEKTSTTSSNKAGTNKQYKITIYKIEKEASYAGQTTITTSDFKDLPAGISVADFTIK
jgi:hypothetical protein